MITNKDIFFISSKWGSGTGFFVATYNIIITSSYVIGFSKTVKISDFEQKLYNSKVIFLDVLNNIAFIEPPTNYNSNISIADFEVVSNLQFVKLYRTNYADDFLISNDEIISNSFILNGLKYYLLKNIGNNNYLGAIATNSKNEVVGIICKKENHQNLLLPAKYIINSLEEFSLSYKNATRCPECAKIIEIKEIQNNICPICSNVIPNELSVDSSPNYLDFENKINTFFIKYYKSFDSQEVGRNFWVVNKNNEKTYINYDSISKFCIIFSNFDFIDSNKTDKILKFLLNENNNNKTFSLSINDKKIILSSNYIPVDNFDDEILLDLLNNIFESIQKYKEKINRIK